MRQRGGFDISGCNYTFSSVTAAASTYPQPAPTTPVLTVETAEQHALPGAITPECGGTGEHKKAQYNFCMIMTTIHFSVEAVRVMRMQLC